MSLKQVKAKIRAVKKTEQVTKAMEAVSAAKMRKAQEWALSARPYAFSAFKILKDIISGRDYTKHPLIGSDESKKVECALFIVITSDRGLAGSLNSSILRLLTRFISENKLQNNASFIAIGRKATEYVSRRKFETMFSQKSFEGRGNCQRIAFEDVVSRREIAESNFRKGKFDRVYVVYTNFITTFAQEASMHQIFPLIPSEVESILLSVRPRKGKYASLFYREPVVKDALFTYEPSTEVVLDSLLSFLAETIIFYAALESKASEHSARMVAMKSAGDKAKEVVKSLTRDYNKERQSIITREMSEIVSGIESLQTK